MARQVRSWVTAAELVAVLRTLQPRHALTLRQLRYLDTKLGIVSPARAGDGPNAGRLYDVVDVALIRLALRVTAGRGARQAWAALRYLEAELRAALRTGGRGQALTFDGGIGRLRPSEPTPGAYELAACLRGVDAALDQVRRTEGGAWTGNRWIADPAAVVRRPTAAARR